MNHRRKLIIALAALPVELAHAQPEKRAGKTMRVGILSSGTHLVDEDRKLLVDTLRELGWVDGRNILYDAVYADNDASRLPALAVALVARAPDLIWVGPAEVALAVFASTRTIPLVFSTSTNVVERGLVKSLARPGGNVTGIQTIGWELGGKRLQLLKQALPKIARVGVLVYPSPDSASQQESKEIEQAAARLGLTVFPAMVRVAGEIDTAIASLVKNRVEAILLTVSPLFRSQRKRILEIAASRRLPVVGTRSEITDDGALLSYSGLVSDQIRRSAQMVNMILKGEKKPADIPVELPTKFELVVNLKTAKMLGITIPGEIMLQATRVIE